MKLTKKQQLLYATVLELIYTGGPISRIDISNHTGITPATVSDITGVLIQSGLIHEIGESPTHQKKSGRKKILLSTLANHSYYLGVELSEKWMTFLLTDNVGNVKKQEMIPLTMSHSETSLDHVFLLAELQSFINQCDAYRISAIGIAIPGHYNQDQKKIDTNNVKWKHLDMAPIIDALDIPIYFENNVHCMTLSERLFNPNMTDNNFILFHVGRGMFSSYLYEGKLYGLDNFLVGEIGHLIVNPMGELCECGRRGCLQTYSSESWIINKASLLYDNSEHTYLRQLAAERQMITIETVLQAYQMGDEGVITILNNAITYLAITLNNIYMLIDSKKILLHGQLFSEASLVELLEETINANQILLDQVHPKEILIKDYSIYNGAKAGCALAISHTLFTIERWNKKRHD